MFQYMPKNIMCTFMETLGERCVLYIAEEYFGGILLDSFIYIINGNSEDLSYSYWNRTQFSNLVIIKKLH